MGLTLGSMGSSRLTATPRLLTRLPVAYAQASRVVSRFRPDVVLATGGYVSVPVALVAQRRHIPVLLLEQNALPGRAVSWLAGRATVVATSFSETAAHLPEARVVCTGNPVRSEFSELSSELLPTDEPRPLLVMGGSQGARHLNDLLLEALPQLMLACPGMPITHLTGPFDYSRVVRDAATIALPAPGLYQPLPFSDQMATLAARAGLVVMRAGGSSLAEVACLGRPMLLIPYPHAGNHQMANATSFAEAGAAVVVDDLEMTAERLVAEVSVILGNPSRCADMAKASHSMARPGAADAVAALLGDLGRGGR